MILCKGINVQIKYKLTHISMGLFILNFLLQKPFWIHKVFLHCLSKSKTEQLLHQKVVPASRKIALTTGPVKLLYPDSACA